MLNYFKELWDKLIKLLQDKFFSTNKYDDIIDELYEDYFYTSEEELDNIVGYKMFNDIIIDCYDSIEEFWETNFS